MKIDVERSLESATKETLKITIEWDPSNEEEDRLAVLTATNVALIQEYHRLNTLIDEDP